MKEIRFNVDKNEWFIKNRGVSFDQIAELLINNKIIAVVDHHNKVKYYNQKLILLEINNQLLIVPYVEEDEYIFLKTAYFNRRYKKIYL